MIVWFFLQFSAINDLLDGTTISFTESVSEANDLSVQRHDNSDEEEPNEPSTFELSASYNASTDDSETGEASGAVQMVHADIHYNAHLDGSEGEEILEPEFVDVEYLETSDESDEWQRTVGY